jgi:hypothetical protein
LVEGKYLCAVLTSDRADEKSSYDSTLPSGSNVQVSSSLRSLRNLVPACVQVFVAGSKRNVCGVLREPARILPLGSTTDGSSPNPSGWSGMGVQESVTGS